MLLENFTNSDRRPPHIDTYLQLFPNFANHGKKLSDKNEPNSAQKQRVGGSRSLEVGGNEESHRSGFGTKAKRGHSRCKQKMGLEIGGNEKKRSEAGV